MGFGVWGLGFGVWGFRVRLSEAPNLPLVPTPCNPPPKERHHHLTRADGFWKAVSGFEVSLLAACQASLLREGSGSQRPSITLVHISIYVYIYIYIDTHCKAFGVRLPMVMGPHRKEAFS